MLCSDEICWGKMPLVVMKFVGAKYGNKNVKIILVKKCPYVVMKYFGGKSCQATYPQGISLLISICQLPVTNKKRSQVAVTSVSNAGTTAPDFENSFTSCLSHLLHKWLEILF